MKYVNKVGKNVQTPWVEERLPLQIFIIGQLAIVGIPSEITTIAARRLRNSVAEVLKERGVEIVITSPYANGYSGYITTPEEYKLQYYEGGHTLFGRWTLPAYQIKFRELARELLKPREERSYQGVEPLIFDRENIWTGFEDPNIRVW
jgi:neutral ceramidase